MFHSHKDLFPFVSFGYDKRDTFAHLLKQQSAAQVLVRLLLSGVRGNTSMERDAFELISFKILMYLSENSEAKDPLVHVVDYWLKQRDKEYVAVKVEKVLLALVARGVIKKVERGRKQIYKINPNRRQEISDLLSLLKPDTD